MSARIHYLMIQENTKMIETILTVCEAASTAHDIYKGISNIVFGNKTEKYLAEILAETKKTNLHIEKLSEKILYAVNFDGVRTKEQRYFEDLKEIHDRLQPFQRALNRPILSSAMVATPRQMPSNPRSFLKDIFLLDEC